MGDFWEIGIWLLNPPVAKTGMGNPFYKASNGGVLEDGKRRVSPKVNSGRETK